MKPFQPMTPARLMLAKLFWAKQKFVPVQYRMEKELEEMFLTFWESAYFFIKLGNLKRAAVEIDIACEKLEDYLKS